MNVDTKLLYVIIEKSQDAIVISDSQNRVLKVNSAFIRLTGYEEQEALGKILFDMHHTKNSCSLFETASEVKDDSNNIKCEIKLRNKEGEALILYCESHVLLNKDGLTDGYLTIILVPKQENDKVYNTKEITQYDVLTDLPNNILLDDRIEQSLIAANRTDKAVSILTFGLDRFTLINEAFGFDIGDMVLKEVASRLEKTMRKSDTVARIGGDRFCMVTAISSTGDSVIVAEKVLKSMKDSFYVQNQVINMTTSIGISIYPTDADNVSRLRLLSENAMHHVKQNGGSGYTFFSKEMNEKAKKRIKIENSLREALKKDEFTLHYQPKVNIGSNAIVGAEALLRWIVPERGYVSPGEFIPVAEESGIIADIGHWVLKQACKDINRWMKKGIQPVRVSINVASAQLRSKNIILQTQEALHKNNIPAAYLELEITESMLMEDPGRAIEILKELRSMDLYISIDDFGTGYSSLSYLSHFPINTLKIDRAFIKDIEENTNNAEITRAIISLSKSLKLEVVAEGAEIAQQIEFLKNQGCNTVQGFYYSKPVPAREFEELLWRKFINTE